MTKLPHITLVITFVGFTVLGSVLASGVPALAHPADDHGSAAPSTGHDPDSAAPSTPHGDGGMSMRDYRALWDAATPSQRRAATDLIERTRAAAERWRDVDAALADGFVARRGGVGAVHYPNFANRRDDRVLDPDHPEALVYLQRPNGSPILLGFVYTVNRTQERPTPAGDLAAWHVHGVPGCHHPDLDPGCSDVRGGMLHVWTYPGVIDPFADPMFASMGSPRAWRSKLLELAGVQRV